MVMCAVGDVNYWLECNTDQHTGKTGNKPTVDRCELCDNEIDVCDSKDWDVYIYGEGQTARVYCYDCGQYGDPEEIGHDAVWGKKYGYYEDIVEYL